VRELILQLVHAVESIHGEIGASDPLLCTEAARRIRLALEENRLNIGDLLPHVVAGKNEHVMSVAQSIELNPRLVLILTHKALEPALHSWRRQLIPLAEGLEWHKGFCFVCGAIASLGELQGNDQVMHLRCGQCGADWPFRRLLCLYCGNEDHNTQKYLYPENEREKMHVEVCEKCKGYIKVIASFAPTPAELLTVEDLATLHLDYLAQEQGYLRQPIL
jgi:FdhE protein